MTHTLRFLFFCLLILFSSISIAQTVSNFIIIDQFGYLPESRKIAVIKNPQQGFDAGESFVAGSTYALVNAISGAEVLRGSAISWNNGQTDPSSGDQVWHFDFSSIDTEGTYYILDIDKNQRSFEFDISPSVYNDVLIQAVRTFFYQRVGFSKEARFAGEGWADGASHIGPLQDKNCRYFASPGNASTEKDVSGGWYDAGDYNKYTNWTANYVVEMMKAYLENPKAWGDDYNIPESGNGFPDLLDEAKWGVDHLLRMQESDGGVLCIVGEDGASPPSLADGQSLYGPATTSASLNTAAALALSAKVFRDLGQASYATTLEAAAIKAWDWANANPNVVFRNNDAAYNSQGLGAGQQEMDDYRRNMTKLEAACYLFDLTGQAVYKSYFDSNYRTAHLFEWTFAYPFEDDIQETLLYYTEVEGASASVASDIEAVYRTAMLNGSENMPAYDSNKDPYLAHIKDYTWGSNRIKAAQGSMFYAMNYYGLNPSTEAKARNAAEGFLHYIHGANPLNMVYLSNMYDYGGDQGVNEFYHTWFANGSAKWDRVGSSTYGPPPGYVTGGANPNYNWDGCCPNNCGSANNNARCTSENINPPLNQPDQKSYKDFNTSWPLNSWSISENSCGYQIAYIRLLSKFVSDASISTDLEPEEERYSLNIYPNPSREWLHIETNLATSGTLKILDIQGRLVLEREVRDKDSLNIEHLSDGYYVVMVAFGDRVFRQKLVKGH